MKKALIPALLLVLVSVMLGATVFRAPLANAAGGIPSMFVANDKKDPLPVEEQNLDADGNIRVHEQGTADVNVRNRRLPALEPVAGGGGGVLTPCPNEIISPLPIFASALQVGWSQGVRTVRLRLGSSVVAEFSGPALTGDTSALALALTRPIAFDRVDCFGTGSAVVGVVGDEP